MHVPNNPSLRTSSFERLVNACRFENTRPAQAWRLRLPWLLALVAMLFCARGAQGTILFWDAGNTNNVATIDPGSGSWNTDATTNLNWNNGSGNVPWTQTSTTSGLNGATFGGPDAAAGTYQVFLDGSQIAFTNLNINANGYVFNGPASMFMNTSGTLLVADGKSVTFSNNFAANNSAKFWQLGTGPVPATMTVYGNIAGDQIVLNATNGSAFYIAGAASGPSVCTIDAPVFLTNGTWTEGATFQIGRSVNGSLGNNTGVFTIDGPNTVMNLTTAIQMSRGGGNGTMNVRNGATVNVGVSGSSAQNVQIESETGNNAHATFNMYDGTLNVGSVGSSTLIGKIWLNQQGASSGATAVFNQTGGVVNAWGGILFGAASGTFTSGIAAVTNSGGYLYIGSGGSLGITRNPGSAATNYISLSGGTVGALGNWISSMPMILDALNGNITFQCADNYGQVFNISLSGALTGPGGLNKSGPGTLQLSGANNYAGTTLIKDGVLKIITTTLPANGPVMLDGSAGSPVAMVSVANPGQYWTMNGDLTYVAGNMTADFNYGTFPPSGSVAPVQVANNVVFTTAPQVSIEGTSIYVGKFPLIKYGGSVVGALPTNPLLPSSTSGYLSNSLPDKTIYLVITSSPVTADLTWRTGSGVWDINNTPNWGLFGSSVKYTEPNSVLFDDTATGPFPITVTNNSVLNPTAMKAIGTNNYILLGTGTIAGSGTLTKSGSGAMTMAGTNTYSGGTIVQSGQLNINYGGDDANSSAIGTGPLTLALGSKLDNTSGQTVTLLPSIAETWQDDWSYLGSGNFNTGPGTVTLGSSVITLNVVTNTIEVAGPVIDNGNNYKIQKVGAGALTLRTDSSFGGGFELAAGTLNLGSSSCLGSGILTIDGGAIDNVSGDDLNLSSVAAISIPIPSGGGWTFLGTTNLDLGSAPITPNSGGTMYWNVVSNTLTTEADILSGNTILVKRGQGRWVLAGSGTGNQSTITVDEGVLELARSGNPSIGSGGAGVGSLGGHGLVVESNSVAIITGVSGNQIAHGNYIQVILDTGGVLDLYGQSQTVDYMIITNGVVRNSLPSGFSTLTIVGTAGNHPTNALTLTDLNGQFDVPPVDATLNIAATITGPGSLVKTGLGTVMLLNSNSYTGNLTISAGTLSLSYPDLATNATVTVAASAVLNLNFDSSFTNTVAALVLNGSNATPGVHNAVTDPAYITGTGSLLVVPLPTINAHPGVLQSVISPGGLSLAWPTNGGWILQTNSIALTATNAWFPYPGSTNLTSISIPVGTSATNVFFRLKKP